MAQDNKKPKGADAIDASLKRVYQDALNEDLPERFLVLLSQLKAQEALRALSDTERSK